MSPGIVFSYKVHIGLVATAISTNPKPTIYRNLYENTGSGAQCGNPLSVEIFVYKPRDQKIFAI